MEEVGQPTTPPAFYSCSRCKKFKVKCTRERPICSRCIKANKGAECVYDPDPDPKVDIPRSELLDLKQRIDQLEHRVRELKIENEDLKRNTSSDLPYIPNTEYSNLENRHRSLANHDGANTDSADTDFEGDFIPTLDGTSIQPRYVAEAACSEFSLRLLRFLKGDSAPPPLQYLHHHDSPKLHRCVGTVSGRKFPSLSRARVLVEAVLNFIGPDYHLILKRSFLETVEKTYQLGYNPYPADKTWFCRMFAVFALGELYYQHAGLKHEQSVPGCTYFESAIELFEDLYEEPAIEYIETVLLLAFYEYALNNRNSAYIRTGLALRLSLTLRLHRKPPENCSPRVREHRIRVWWTVYILDRISSSKVGLPFTVRDEDIDTPPPSLDGLTDFDVDDFHGLDHINAQLNLARITGKLLSAIYRTTRLDRTNDFLQNVREVVGDLTEWRKTLPSILEFNLKAKPPYSSRSVASLHLNFSQCVILTTRSIFFYVFAFKIKPIMHQHATSPQTILPGSEEFAETCVRAARRSSKILRQLQIGRDLAMYGFFDALAVFSSALILMMSSTVRFKATPADDIAVENLQDLLKEMKDAGNMSARDYYQELMECKGCLDQAREQMYGASDSFLVTPGQESGLGHLMNANDWLGTSQQGPGTDQVLDEQMNDSDPGGFDTSNLLMDPGLQAQVQDPNISWDPDSFNGYDSWMYPGMEDFGFH